MAGKTITFSLIRQAHAASASTVEELEALQSICLAKHGIAHIDNLEVFWDARELDLSGNVIEQIENVDFLDKLERLDLSSNRITGTALLRALDVLPRNLQAINLSGNPCADDEGALGALADRHPGLNIIIGLYRDDEVEDEADAAITRQLSQASGVLATPRQHAGEEKDGGDEEDEDDDEGEGDAEDEEDDEYDPTPLNDDDVLKALVDRKCRLQNLSPMNVSKAVDALNVEYDEAIKTGAAKTSKRWGDVVSKSAHDVNARLAGYQQQIRRLKDDMKENADKDAGDVAALTARLKRAAKSAMLSVDPI